ncbi:carboxyltransferase domain-containing protein, partial [Escherichia coli]|nr:carboxyltransferase domain-containing protein [Escherichia coli]
MQRARCYLIGETAVVLELEPPVTLASQKRIWRLAQRLVDMPNVVEAIPGMNNITVILRNPESLALNTQGAKLSKQNHAPALPKGDPR